MFKARLKSTLQQIFGIPKVSYDLPGESREQDCLFVDIQSSNASVKKTREVASVRGTILMYSSNDKLPFGFFSKKINQADPELTYDICFFNIDENTRTFQNIVERRCNFLYLYSNDYDPEGGEITSVEFEEGNA